MKGFLKRLSGALKYATMGIPALLLAYGIGASVGGMVESVNNTKTLKGFYASAPVQQVIQSELDELDQDVLDGKYTFTQAADKNDEIKSDKHLKDVTDNVYKDNAEYQASVKTIARDFGLITSGLIGASIGLFAGYLWYVGKDGIAYNLKESAEENFAEENYNGPEIGI